MTVYAIRYGSLETTRSASFLDFAGFGEPDGPITLDYFYWVIVSPDSVILVDTGFDAGVGRRRGRDVLVEPLEALGHLGIAPGDVDQVIVTHFHYDHVGNVSAFPGAELSFQQLELEFWTGPEAQEAEYAALVEPAEIKFLADAAASGRARCLNGDTELAPGVHARLVGGHTPGQQIVTVETHDGPVVLASDALHFYEEMERGRPYSVARDPQAMMSAYRGLEEMRSQGASIVAGHDPAVMTRYRSTEENVVQIAA